MTLLSGGRFQQITTDQRLIGKNETISMGSVCREHKCFRDCMESSYCTAFNMRLQENPCQCELFSFDLFRSGINNNLEYELGTSVHLMYPLTEYNYLNPK